MAIILRQQPPTPSKKSAVAGIISDTKSRESYQSRLAQLSSQREPGEHVQVVALIAW